MFQTQQGNPFVDQLAPMVNINPHNPPPIPQLNNIHPQIQQNMQLIFAHVAAEIQNNAGRNPFTRFMHNSAAQNGWENPYWGGLVVEIVKVMHIWMEQNAYSSLEAVVSTGLPQLVEALSVAVVNDATWGTQAKSFINQNDGQAMAYIQGQLNKLAAVRGMGNRVQGGGANFNNGGGGMNAGQRWQMQNGPGSDLGDRYRQSGVSSATGLFRQSGGNNVSTGVASVDDARFNYAAPAQSTTKTTETPKPKEAAMQATEKLYYTQKDDDVRWYPSEAIKVLPAVNPEHTLLVFVKQGKDFVPTVIKKDVNAVDYNKHVLPSGFGDIPNYNTAESIRQKLLAIDKGVQQLNQDVDFLPDTDMKDMTPEEKAILASSMIRNTMTIDHGITSGWLNAAANRAEIVGAKANPQIYRQYSRVFEPILTREDQNDLLQSLRSSETFIILREKLRAAMPTSPLEENSDQIQLLAAVNRGMTDAVNRVLKQNMSIEERILKIGSFVDEIDQAMAIIQEHLGHVFMTPLLKNQKDVIRSVLGRPFDTQAQEQEYVENFLSDFQYTDKKPAMSFLSTTFSLTLINVRAFELGLELALGVSSNIAQDLTPVVYNLVEEIFNEKQPVHADRHLIRTIDGYVFETTRAYLNKELYQLTLLEK